MIPFLILMTWVIAVTIVAAFSSPSLRARCYVRETFTSRVVGRAWYPQSLSALPKGDTESSSFEQSSPVVKALVGGLTSLVNIIFGAKEDDFKQRSYLYTNISPEQLAHFIKQDFDNGYLFSGEINPEIYCEDCSFTDPTISFQGLSTFESNIKNLKPILDRFIGERFVTLYSIDLNKSEKQVTARWKMSGEVLFPWRPRIVLTGKTSFTYDGNAAGRVRSYYEVWDAPAYQVLLQLLYSARDEDS